MAVKFLRAIGLLLLWWCGSACAEPADLIVERAWVEDPTGQMTLAQVRQAPEQPLAGAHFDQGFSASASWIRLRIDPTRADAGLADERLVMRIRPSYLDDIQLFDPLDSRPQPQVTGDRYPQSRSDYRSLNLNFVLPRGDRPRDVWVRLQATTSMLSTFEVLTESEARARDWRQFAFGMMSVSVLCVCTVWGLLIWFLQRDRLVLLYVARELQLIFCAIVIYGAFRAMAWDWVSPEWIDRIGNFCFSYAVVALVWFDIRLLEKFQPHPWLLRALKVSWLCFVALAVMALLGFPMLRLNALGQAITSVLLLLTACCIGARAAASADELPRWTIVGTYLILTLVVLFLRAMALGWVAPVGDILLSALIYVLTGSFMMMGLLQVRVLRLYRRQQDVHLNLRLAERMAHEERVLREERELLLAMLGHELRNALMAVGFLVDERSHEWPQVRRALDDMGQVLERSVQSSQLAEAGFSPQLSEFDFHALMQEVCHRSDRVALVNLPLRTLVQSDRMWLLIVLGNLLDNALKYSPPDSRVHVVCTRFAQDGRDTLRIRVANEPGSAGLPDPQQLFQKYYRSSRAHQQIGSGLGLYLVKSFLDMLAGRIAYLPPVPGQAPEVVFEVELPVVCPTR